MTTNTTKRNTSNTWGRITPSPLAFETPCSLLGLPVRFQGLTPRDVRNSAGSGDELTDVGRADLTLVISLSVSETPEAAKRVHQAHNLAAPALVRAATPLVRTSDHAGWSRIRRRARARNSLVFVAGMVRHRIDATSLSERSERE